MCDHTTKGDASTQDHLGHFGGRDREVVRASVEKAGYFTRVRAKSDDRSEIPFDAQAPAKLEAIIDDARCTNDNHVAISGLAGHRTCWIGFDGDPKARFLQGFGEFLGLSGLVVGE
jgi:hypothetical protein